MIQNVGINKKEELKQIEETDRRKSISKNLIIRIHGGMLIDVRFRLRSQLVDATHALNLLAGVSNSNVLRGRSFN